MTNATTTPLTRRTLALGTAAALAMPGILRAQSAGDTIKIGVMTPVTGPAAEAGTLQQNGIKMALSAVNEKGVLGRKFEIVTEDDQTTNPGAVLAFSRLASRPDIVAFIGSIRSTQVNADGAGRAEDRQAHDVRRHRPDADPAGQPLAVPLPAQRQLLRQGDRRLRRGAS